MWQAKYKMVKCMSRTVAKATDKKGSKKLESYVEKIVDSEQQKWKPVSNASRNLYLHLSNNVGTNKQKSNLRISHIIFYDLFDYTKIGKKC